MCWALNNIRWIKHEYRVTSESYLGEGEEKELKYFQVEFLKGMLTRWTPRDFYCDLSNLNFYVATEIRSTTSRIESTMVYLWVTGAGSDFSQDLMIFNLQYLHTWLLLSPLFPNILLSSLTPPSSHPFSPFSLLLFFSISEFLSHTLSSFYLLLLVCLFCFSSKTWNKVFQEIQRVNNQGRFLVLEIGLEIGREKQDFFSGFSNLLKF